MKEEQNKPSGTDGGGGKNGAGFEGLKRKSESVDGLGQQKRAKAQRRSTTLQDIIAASSSATNRRGECPISAEALHAAAVGVLLSATGRRVSAQFFNLNALKRWFKLSQTCPITGQRAHRVLELPDIRADPAAWFKIVDMDGDGKLSRTEIIDALKAQLPIDCKRLDMEAKALWAVWDKDGSGFIEEAEFFGPEGMVAAVSVAFEIVSTAPAAIPSIGTDRKSWFAFFDEDKNCILEEAEFRRGMIKTLHLGMRSDDIVNIGHLCINLLWDVYLDAQKQALNHAEREASEDPPAVLGITEETFISLSLNDSLSDAITVQLGAWQQLWHAGQGEGQALQGCVASAATVTASLIASLSGAMVEKTKTQRPLSALSAGHTVLQLMRELQKTNSTSPSPHFFTSLEPMLSR
jgi:hypothetical protein